MEPIYIPFAFILLLAAGTVLYYSWQDRKERKEWERREQRKHRKHRKH